jgi:hypothetical protein
MNTKLKLAAAVLATALTGTASAGIVTEWAYDNQAGFVTYSPEGVTASGDSATGSSNFLPGGSYPTTLSWGNQEIQSNLDIDSAVVGLAETNGAFVDGTDITHNNFPISGTTLESATVLDGLLLTPSDWDALGSLNSPLDNSPFSAPFIAFGISFYETFNASNPCPDGNPNGFGDNINGCGDIFEVTGLDALGITPTVGEDFIEFTVPFWLSTGHDEWDSVTYYITTRLSGLTVLPDGYQCKDGSPCFGFVTKENTSNVLQASFKIRVPEPGTIGLFGLALIGTAFAGRRKQA